MTSRRKFLQNSVAIAGSSLLVSSLNNDAFAIFKNPIAASDQLNIGLIGVHGMGWADLTSALKVPGVNVVALCDVDKNVLDKRMIDLSKLNVDATKVKTYSDYR